MAVFAPFPSFTLRAQPQLTQAQAAALQPTPPALVPKSGDFYSISFPGNPLTPFDPYPDLPVYRLPDNSLWVDDTSIPFPPPGQKSDPLAASHPANGTTHYSPQNP